MLRKFHNENFFYEPFNFIDYFIFNTMDVVSAILPVYNDRKTQINEIYVPVFIVNLSVMTVT